VAVARWFEGQNGVPHLPLVDGAGRLLRDVLWALQATDCRTADGQRGVPGPHLVSITREDDTDAITDFWEEDDGDWPVATNPSLDAFQADGVQDIPTKVLLSADDEEVWRHTGLAAAETIVEEVETVE